MKCCNLQRFFKNVLLLTIALVSFKSIEAREFVHPGLSHKQSDLDRMRYMVKAGVDPWLTSYNNLKADSKASASYVVRGNTTMTTITQDGLNYGAFSSDVKAAYLNALMWAITGDEPHAQKCVEIFNAWSNITCFTGGGTESLNAGRVIWNLLEAAEIINHTYNGWSETDIQKFKDMLVYPGLSHSSKPSSVTNDNGTFYWRMYQGDAGRHGNQDLFGWRGVMAMGVFLDDEIVYDRALRYLKGLPHRSDDIPYQSGPPNVSTSPLSTNEYFDAYSFNGWNNTEEDYGYNGVLENYIWENGQLQESSRDQDHAILGVGMCASLAEIAWNQGDDLYSYLNNRILKGYEFALHYNISYAYSYPDQTSPWEPTVESGEFIQRRDRTGRWFSKKMNPHYEADFEKISRGGFRSDIRPIYELAYAHYGVREGESSENMKWLMRARDISLNEYGQEQNGWSLDHLGWGGLTCYRLDGMAGDPCTYQNGNLVFGVHMIPGAVQAEDFDYFTGDGEGRTYKDNSGSNTGGAYRTDEAVDLEACSAGGYNVTGIESGEWVTYTIEVSDDATYDLMINYAAASGNGKIKFVIGGADKTGETTVPFGGDYSTGINDWKEIVLKTDIQLSAGVQTMKVLFSGASNSFKLNNISLEKPGKLDDEFVSSLDGWISATSGATAEAINGELKMTLATLSNGKKRGDMRRSQGASLHAGNYPIVAFKMQAPAVANIIFDTSIGSFGHGANKWTGKIGDDVYYFNMATTGFGSSNTMLSTTSATNLSTFQFKVADITSGEDNYTCDWVKTFASIEDLKASLPGKLNDEFDTSLDGWIATTSGATAEAINGELKMTLATLSNGKKRGDMKRSQGATLHAGYYPIVAFKMQAPAVANIIFDTSMGSFGNGANKWTGKIGDDVYYYDLSATGFGTSNTKLSTSTDTELSTFQFKVADITSGENSYTCDWVKAFESEEELQALIGLKSTFVQSSTPVFIDNTIEDIKCYFSNSAIHIENLSTYTSVSVFGLSGIKLVQNNTNDSQLILPWNKNGIYLVNIRTKNLNKTIKIVCQNVR